MAFKDAVDRAFLRVAMDAVEDREEEEEEDEDEDEARTRREVSSQYVRFRSWKACSTWVA